MNIPLKHYLLGLFCFLLFIGIVGEFTPLAPVVRSATPLIFILCTALLLLYEQPFGYATLLYVALIGAIGFVAEYVGVHFGILFGLYRYGDVLGPQIKGIPLVVSLLWIIMSLCSHSMAVLLLPRSIHRQSDTRVNRSFSHSNPSVYKHMQYRRVVQVGTRALLASGLMVSMDVLIEPMAIRSGFWSWAQGTPPLQNYIGWAIVSLSCQLVIVLCAPSRKNAVGSALFLSLLVFFIVHNGITYIL